MIPGTRVRLTRAPHGYERLQGKVGKILRLLPIPQQPLVYCSTFESEFDTDLNVSPDDVEVLIHHEASPSGNSQNNGGSDKNNSGENNISEMMIEINGLSFCKDHRLETCGTCGLDLRFENLVKELGDFQGVEECAVELDRALDKMNAPQRHAPGSKAFKPVVTPAIDVLPTNLDPSTLSAFEYHLEEEKDNSCKSAEKCVKETLPLQRVRKKIFSIGKHAYALQQQREQGTETEASDNSPISIALRDEAKSEVLRLEIVEPVRLLSSSTSDDPNADSSSSVEPLLIVRWFHMRCSNQAAVAQPEATLNMESRLDELALLAEILKANATKLEPSFVFLTKATAPFALSALATIPAQCETTYYDELGEYCHRCGTSGTKMFHCSRCKVVTFCSRVCRKKNWKYHKNECVPVTS